MARSSRTISSIRPRGRRRWARPARCPGGGAREPPLAAALRVGEMVVGDPEQPCAGCPPRGGSAPRRQAPRRTSPRSGRPPAPGRACGGRGTRAAARRGGQVEPLERGGVAAGEERVVGERCRSHILCCSEQPAGCDRPYRRISRRWCGRGVAAAPCSRCGATVPELVVDRASRRVPCAGTSSSTACNRAGADLDLLGRAVLDQLPASMRATRSGSNSSTPSIRRTWGTRLSLNIVSAATSRGRDPCRCRSAAESWARLKNGTSSPS